jgi:ArsR family transcriptional regulator
MALGYIAKEPRMEAATMDAKTQARFEARARVLKALAHPTRLFIVERLAHGEECVCRLTDLVGADMSTVSKHLAILRSAGILQDEKRANQVYYRLRCPCVTDFFGCVEGVLKARAAQ